MAGELPAALLLDLDDTILEFAPLAPRVWREVCGTYAPRLQGVDPQTLYAEIQCAARGFWSDPERERRGRLDLPGSRREIVSAAFGALGVEGTDVARAVADRFTELREERIEPLPGALEALDAFRARGIRLGLVTNGGSAPQRAKIERFGLTAYFDAILVEGEFGVGKPDAAVFREALWRLDAKPERTRMAGDNLEWDVAGSQRLGIFGIWIDAEVAGVPAGSAVRPDRIVRSLAELAPDR